MDPRETSQNLLLENIAPNQVILAHYILPSRFYPSWIGVANSGEKSGPWAENELNFLGSLNHLSSHNLSYPIWKENVLLLRQITINIYNKSHGFRRAIESFHAHIGSIWLASDLMAANTYLLCVLMTLQTEVVRSLSLSFFSNASLRVSPGFALNCKNMIYSLSREFSTFRHPNISQSII